MLTASTSNTFELRDYRLTGRDTVKAIQAGLAEATWYTSPVPRETLRELLERKDGPAIRDTAIWLVLIIGSGAAGFALWGSWWAIIPFMVYGVLYASTSDSRWHESGHGTAFKTDWMNNALYEVASFMVLRESVPWRWSHARHHSDTIIVGRDPEIAVPRPPSVPRMIAKFLGLRQLPAYIRNVTLHCLGRLTPEEKTYIPASEYRKVFRRARIYALIHGGVIALAVGTGSLLPLMYVGLPNLYGAWLMVVYGTTQHAGLAENVLDHRLNCRTVYMCFVHRFLYWNMNYHLEHHMFPLVPYHALPRLHELIKADCPPAYPSLLAAWREIVPAVWRQIQDPTYFVERTLPTPTVRAPLAGSCRIVTAKGAPVEGWVEVCVSAFLQPEDVLRFDHDEQTYAICRTADGALHATDGICTHGKTHLAEGFVKGTILECPKHNGRFDVTDGSPRRLPACVALRTYPVRETDGKIFLFPGANQPAKESRAGRTGCPAPREA
jgi:MocE subfamily Rieske [2Fe-2S] domain protein